MEAATILVRGAREHNLRNVNLELPRNRLIVFTGVSGSGKSSLAFDTLIAEGQRRYIESLSSYARQFLGQLPKPDVDHLSGLSPAISIQQKTAGSNPRSTVGTITEIHDFLRVLYARLGRGYCPKCQVPIAAQSREQIVTRVLAQPPGRRVQILAPIIRGQKGEFRDLFAEQLRRGYLRARVDGKFVQLTEQLKLDRHIKHDIDVVVDRVKLDADARTRLAESVEQALKLTDGTLLVLVESAPEVWQEELFSTKFACLRCGQSYPPPNPQLFSFNSPQGMCLDCDGLGVRTAFSEELLIPDADKSFRDGAIPLVGLWSDMGRWRRHLFQGLADTLGLDLTIPWKRWSPSARAALLHGTGDRLITYAWRTRGGVWKHTGTWEGLIAQFQAAYRKAVGPHRAKLEKYMTTQRCPTCQGQRLNAQARAVRLADRTLVECEALPIDELAEWFRPGGELDQSLSPVEASIAAEVLKEIRGRLQFLLDVGLNYLSLDRTAPTLSGGETQRIRLAGQIGCGLVGVLYILDEPSIGLHPRDNRRLLNSLERLRDLGNTVIVVEHDEETMRAADYLVDFGPGPGVRGGEVVAAGTFDDITREPRSLTGQYLNGIATIPIPSRRRAPSARKLKVVGATCNNLKNLNVNIPLGLFVGVTGVSGSGKSSLVNEVLLTTLKAELGKRRGQAHAATDNDDANDDAAAPLGQRMDVKRISGLEHIDKIIAIDQSPIGRTPRSNPATYIKVFDEIRQLFAKLPQAKVRGYKPGRFSFNVAGGRCGACDGNGSTRLEMDFLADVWVPCPVCEGRRFNRETLQVRFKDKSIHDILEMDVQEALAHFSEVPRIRAMLQTLHDVGLDYLKLGQPSPTLSGGEAQRVKLARELCHPSQGHTIYILDEPTTGLHFEDVRKLLEVLHGFVANGHTVVVIEHNLDVIKTVDWIIDLGPEGGAAGGTIVAQGTPEAVAACPESFTGQALQSVLYRPERTAGRKRPKKNVKARTSEVAPARITEVSVIGAAQNNLKNITVSFPREAMTTCCGLSGSGKSTFAIDTVYAEGQRRYVESLSSYARQFLGKVQKPKVEHVTGLSPAICIEQKTTSKSPRSTVGTVTEIHDYLRVLYARLGQAHCPTCGIPVGTQTADEIIEKFLALPEGTKLYLMAPIERKGQEAFSVLWEEVRRAGFLRVRVDGTTYNLDEVPDIDRRRHHTVEVVIDRIVIRQAQRSRLADAVEAALDFGKGVVHIAHVNDSIPEPKWKVEKFSQHLACTRCGRSFEHLAPHHFSFNSALGWCPSCEGLGVQQGAAAANYFGNSNLSIAEGAITGWPPLDTPGFRPLVEALVRHLGVSVDSPLRMFPAEAHQAILYGTGEEWMSCPDPPSQDAPPLRFQYKGLIPALDEAKRVSYVYRRRFSDMVTDVPCTTCHGSRLRDDAAAFRFHGKTMGQVGELPLRDALAFFRTLKLTKREQQIAGELIREVTQRLQFLVDVGLDYLTLNRSAPTLSGGEAQRIRLASQIGSGLTGVLYVLDEPTIGLHPRDNGRLLAALKKLRDLGNTLLLVEHDREVIAAADCLLDFGPGAGDFGGHVVAHGPPAAVARHPDSLTGRYLGGQQAIIVPKARRITVDADGKPQPPKGQWLRLTSVRHNNLADVNVAFPLGCLVAVTGVSGSGKSSLVNDVLYAVLAKKLHRAQVMPGDFDSIDGLVHVDKVINVDQTPLGNTPGSNPATFTGLFDLLRQLFAKLPQAKVRGYQPRRFSFNMPGGRCEACEGMGQKRIEMHFLPDVWVECENCHGRRYAPETLEVLYKGHSIADVLDMRISQALHVFEHQPRIMAILQCLADVGLGYLSLGQAAPTLSGGEAQRVKLAAELSRPSTGRTVYLLDEPTTGLHFEDVRRLLDVLHHLVDLGNTVIVVEHNLDVMKSADWIIDLGPDAGAAGGRIVVEGTPEQVAAAADRSHTAAALAPVLRAGPVAARPQRQPTPRIKPTAEAVHDDDTAAAPWEVDGRRWHTQQRVSATGHPCKWEGKALTWLIDRIEETQQFGPTNWQHRTQVEVAAKVKSKGWFLHATTQDENLLWLSFRVAKGTFSRAALERGLKLARVNDLPGLRIYNQVDRIRHVMDYGPWQYVSFGVHTLKEIDTPFFRTFLRTAMDAFHANLSEIADDVERFMPWKIDGRAWHLSDKGFPPRKKAQWDRALLPKLVALLESQATEAVVRWNNQLLVSFKLPGCRGVWASIYTKNPEHLGLELLGPAGRFNLARLEVLGVPVDLSHRRRGGDLVGLKFVNQDHWDEAALRDFLSEHVQAFREAFPAAADEDDA